MCSLSCSLMLAAAGAAMAQPPASGGEPPAQPPAATPAPAQPGAAPAPGAQAAPAAPVVSVADKSDTIIMVDGTRVVAPILKETSEALWLDLGNQVVQVPRSRVDSIQRANKEDRTVGTVVSDKLFRTATDLPERTPKELARQFGEAVIMISTPSGLGSGFIIHPDGYALTNAHVIQGERKIKVTLFEQVGQDFRRRIIEDVQIIAVNNHLDLGLIKIKDPDGRPLPTVYLQSSEELAAGQNAFAIGAPLGLERTLSRGVVSTTQRNFEGITYIQTDTLINPGNSGGPLFNDKGEVIGVTNMKIPLGEGLSFAIPARYVRDFLRNRDAFAYDKDNPNSGYTYNEPPRRTVFEKAPLDDASGAGVADRGDRGAPQTRPTHR